MQVRDFEAWSWGVRVNQTAPAFTAAQKLQKRETTTVNIGAYPAYPKLSAWDLKGLDFKAFVTKAT